MFGWRNISLVVSRNKTHLSSHGLAYRNHSPPSAPPWGWLQVGGPYPVCVEPVIVALDAQHQFRHLISIVVLQTYVRLVLCVPVIPCSLAYMVSCAMQAQLQPSQWPRPVLPWRID